MFHARKKAFKAMIYDADISPEEYTVGEPQKLVDNFRKRMDKNQLVLVGKLWIKLERRFGNVAALTNVLLQRLEDAAQFSEDDAKKLQDFSDLCDNVVDQMTQLPGLRVPQLS